jgi:hypothetical protein
MAEITLKFDARNPIAKKTLDYILSIGVFKSVTKKSAIEISLEDVKKGRVKKYKDANDLFEKVLS